MPRQGVRHPRLRRHSDLGPGTAPRPPGSRRDRPLVHAPHTHTASRPAGDVRGWEDSAQGRVIPEEDEATPSMRLKTAPGTGIGGDDQGQSGRKDGVSPPGMASTPASA
ncbi:hypothetical protein GCM10010284_51630 [Streptomyces rubiginosohelvolus]|uniref:Uncharacterized protein n=1 Tax=Streptomyces rubiginosohelvolus TaxID=67362 RepID=A0ABQ3C8N3_9ACTN|nr:hypothetical protein GCM10010284_51630 [Streptomyces rubiginosohelvolus]GGZ74868.1 hypothetical protein GCM10010328_57220 [Streptomyces pluricolorescens]